jgi:hypothetical protein
VLDSRPALAFVSGILLTEGAVSRFLSLGPACRVSRLLYTAVLCSLCLHELAVRAGESSPVDCHEKASGCPGYQDRQLKSDPGRSRGCRRHAVRSSAVPLEDEPADRTGIPLAGIQGIATRNSDPRKTTLLVVGIGVVAFAALCAADTFGCGPEENPTADAIGTNSIDCFRPVCSGSRGLYCGLGDEPGCPGSEHRHKEG